METRFAQRNLPNIRRQCLLEIVRVLHQLAIMVKTPGHYSTLYDLVGIQS